MELSSVLPIVMVVAAGVLASMLAIRFLLERSTSIAEKVIVLTKEQGADLKALNERVEALEHGKAAESLGEETLNQFSDRLAKVEQTIEPLKGKPEFSSPEFNLLLYEIEKIEQAISSRQGSFEGSYNDKFATLRFTFSVFLVVITVLLSLAIYFLTIRGA